MKGRLIVWGGAAVLALGLGGFGGWILSLPPAPAAAGAPPIDSGETQAIVDALKPRKRQRPAMSRDDDPAALSWIRSQADRGATVIGVCAGAKVVGAAGLLDGRREQGWSMYPPK